jgi:hypothetical protein
VRRTHPRPAVRAHLGALHDPGRGEAFAQGATVEEVAGGVQQRRAGQVDRAGDVTGHRIDRLVLAAEALRRASVEQNARPGREGRGAGRVEQRHPAGSRRKGARLDRDLPPLDGEPGGHPATETPIQNTHLGMPEVPQQPPRPGRRDRAAHVVDNHRPVCGDSRCAHRGLEVVRRWKRVAPADPRGTGQRRVEVDEHRPRDVALEVVREAGSGQLPANVQKGSVRRDFINRDQRVGKRNDVPGVQIPARFAD